MKDEIDNTNDDKDKTIEKKDGTKDYKRMNTKDEK